MAEERAPNATSGTAGEPSRLRKLFNLFLGRPLATSEGKRQQLGPLLGIPVLGLDALCSSSYGPEAALTLLLPLGASGVASMVPITSVIVALALIVYSSYRQTILAYPTGGGSYSVARANLGPRLGLVAAAALACDYVLNVAVAISAGVGALVSAIPVLLPHVLPLCLGILLLLVLVNLRGTRDAGLAFMLPTYLFLGTLITVLALGLARALLSSGSPVPVVAPRPLAAPTEAASTWLLLRAFSSGCTAMTGIEAVSNGVTAFREPRAENAQRTLGLIVGLLATLLVGIALSCRAYGVGATVPGSPEYESILSQLTAAVVGRGAFYYLTLGSTVVVLCLSANTSFADFPRLCNVLARDGYLPDLFALRGRRLVFSSGVVLLAVLAGALLVTFGGVTDRLIPLFAVGAFVAFTLSQSGMVVHWRGRGRRRALALNLLGAVCTGVTALVVAVSKFAEGAWIAVIALLATAFGFDRIHRHYASVARELADTKPLVPSPPATPVVIVTIQAWDKLARRALSFARGMSDEIHALHVLTEDAAVAELTSAWEDLVVAPARAAGMRAPELVLRRSRYREFFRPIIDYVNVIRGSHPDRDIVIVVPSVVPKRWYHAPLHNERSTLLRALLRLRGPERVIIVSIPVHLSR